MWVPVFFCTEDLNIHQILKRFYNPPKSKEPLIQIQPLHSTDEAAQSKSKRQGWEKTKAGSAAVQYWSMDLTSMTLNFLLLKVRIMLALQSYLKN